MKCNYSIPKSCPLGSTHRQLEAAHIAWHQLLDSDADIDLFSANLNAALQALRNISFRLQAEKDKFGDFSWYENWRTTAKASLVLSWLVESRNHVVKVSDLKTLSVAKASLCAGWTRDIVFHTSVPADMPAKQMIEEVRRKLPLPADCAALILIERRWLVPEFPNTDLFELIKSGFLSLRDLVLEAHSKLPEAADCAAGLRRELPCLNKRSETTLAIRGDHTIEMARVSLPPPPFEDLKKAAEWYGTGSPPFINIFDDAAGILEHAKRILIKDGYHHTMALLRTGTASRHVSLPAANSTEKVLMIRQLAKEVRSSGADVVILVAEIWLHGPGGQRKEGLQVVRIAKDGKGEALFAIFSRKPDGIVFEETISNPNVPDFLRPIADVWRDDDFQFPTPKHIDLKQGDWGSPAVMAYCKSAMVPAMSKPKPVLHDWIAYTSARNLVASMDYAEHIDLPAREAALQSFLGRYSDILAPEIGTAISALPFLHEDSLTLWLEPRIEILKKLLSSKPLALDASRRFWTTLFALSGTLNTSFEKKTNTDVVRLRNDLAILRLCEGFVGEFLSLCSMEFGHRSRASILPNEKGEDFVQIELSKESTNDCLNGAVVPHPFFEFSMPLLSYIVSLGPSVVRSSLNDGAVLNWESMFHGPNLLQERQEQLIEFSQELLRTVDFNRFPHEKDFVLKINSSGIDKIVVRALQTKSPLELINVKIVYRDRSREICAVARTAQHNCTDGNCRAKRFNGVLVDYFSNKISGAVDPHFSWQSAISVAHIMPIAVAFIRDLIVIPSQLDFIRQRQARMEYRIPALVYQPELVCRELAASIPTNLSALSKAFGSA